MAANERIERALTEALAVADHPGCPPRFREVLNYAVFPGGARIRPRLTFAVAMACGDSMPETSDAACAAVELLHCASLVHDDLPCFDDSPMRRGKPSVHSRFGERLAVLCGDALIVTAFQTLARGASGDAARLSGLIKITSEASALPQGMAAGQAWECESDVCLEAYHQAKTGSLFAAATMAGAVAAGENAEPWRLLGQSIGDAYQVADDLRDRFGDEEVLGKPTGRDSELGRPNAVDESGAEGAVGRLKALIQTAMSSIPDCDGSDALRELIADEAKKFIPKVTDQRAA